METFKIILPIIILGVIAIFIVEYIKKSSKKSDDEDENYMTEGMEIGMGVGAALGILLNSQNFVTFIPIGMMFGMVIVMSIKKQIFNFEIKFIN